MEAGREVDIRRALVNWRMEGDDKYDGGERMLTETQIVTCGNSATESGTGATESGTDATESGTCAAESGTGAAESGTAAQVPQGPANIETTCRMM